jgi:hypothetical protein
VQILKLAVTLLVALELFTVTSYLFPRKSTKMVVCTEDKNCYVLDFDYLQISYKSDECCFPFSDRTMLLYDYLPQVL